MDGDFRGRRQAKSVRCRATVEAVERRVLFAAATHTVIVGLPPNLAAGETFGLTAELVDDNGDVDTAAGGSATVGVYGGGATLVGTRSVIVDHGIATYADLAVTTAGTFAFVAASGDLPTYVSAAVPVHPTAPAMFAFANLVPTTSAGGSLTTSFNANVGVKVTLEDAYGNATPIATSITVATSDGHTATMDAPAGVGYFTSLVVTRTGQATLTATAPGVPATTSAPFQVDPGPAAALAVVAQPAPVVAGQPFAGVTIATVDAYGNATTLAGAQPVQVQLLKDGQAVGGPTAATITDGRGVLLAGQGPTTAGTYAVTVRDFRPVVTPLTAVQTQPFAVTAGPAAHLSVATATNATLIAETGRPVPTLTVTVVDEFNNAVVTDSGSTVTVAATGPLSGTSDEATTAGRATFADLSFAAAGSYLLTFTDGAVPAAVVPVTVRPPLLKAATFAAGRPIGSVVVDVRADFPGLDLGVRANRVLTLTLDSGDAVDFTPKIARASIHNGFATVPVPVLRRTGTYSLGVIAADGSDLYTQFAVVPTPPARLAFFGDPRVNDDRSVSATVRLYDRFGNIAGNAQGTAVTLGLVGPRTRGGSPSLSGTTTSQVDRIGDAEFSGLMVTPGVRLRLRAVAPRLRSVVSKPFTIG